MAASRTACSTFSEGGPLDHHVRPPQWLSMHVTVYAKSGRLPILIHSFRGKLHVGLRRVPLMKGEAGAEVIFWFLLISIWLSINTDTLPRRQVDAGATPYLSKFLPRSAVLDRPRPRSMDCFLYDNRRYGPRGPAQKSITSKFTIKWDAVVKTIDSCSEYFSPIKIMSQNSAHHFV